MRIVGGQLRGRVLQAPAGLDTRPTSDRARQAIFNILEHAPWSDGVGGARVIDLFAGSGAMGLEALSRGAASCLFVETAGPARAAITANLKALRLEDRAGLDRRDAAALGARGSGEPFTLAFLDPPYAKGLNERALAALRGGGWLAPGAICVVERGAGEPPVAPEGFEALDDRGYGAAAVGFLRRT